MLNETGNREIKAGACLPAARLPAFFLMSVVPMFPLFFTAMLV